MAIYGVGSVWGEEEQAKNFFKKEAYTLGWNEKNASDIFNVIGTLKAGDILYLKSAASGSRTIRVKGIGIVKKSFISSFNPNASDIGDYQSLSLSVAWLIKDEFKITIPAGDGKLTNVRAATVYEEFLPYVQQIIIDKITQSGGLENGK